MLRRPCLPLVLVTIAFSAACSHGRRDGTDMGVAANDDMHVAVDSGIVVTIDGGHTQLDGGTCVTCSGDLHSVLDCSGNVIATCAADEGCSPTQGCVPACTAASANRTSVGCEYYAPTPPPFFEGGTCYAVYVANTWGTPVTLSVDRAGTTLDVDTFGVIPSGGGQSITYAPLVNGALPTDAVAILFLDSEGGRVCPSSLKTAATGAAFTGTAIGSAFHVSASAPVVAYDIYPYGGGSSAIASASLLQPTSAWDTSYVAITMPETYSLATYGAQSAPSWIGIVAQADGTNVSVRPSFGVQGSTTVQGGPANMPITYSMAKGEFLKLEQDTELSGSFISSDQPVAVFGGVAATQLPVGMVAADSMHQQIPPAHAIGNRYAAVRYRNRIVANPDETPPWTLVGIADDTMLTYDPPIPGAPVTISAGAVVRFNAAGPFVVSSQDNQHPFYFAQHMTGWQVASPETSPGVEGPNGSPGDPEWVNVVPPAQYLSRYVFFTDPTYPTTDLVFVRQKINGAFADITLDCAGTLTGWKPVDSGDDLEYVTFDLIDGNFVKHGTCDNGRHIAQSTNAFGLTVWGWGTNATGTIGPDGHTVIGYYSEAVSYAYPAGQSVALINDVPIPPPVQ